MKAHTRYKTREVKRGHHVILFYRFHDWFKSFLQTTFSHMKRLTEYSKYKPIKGHKRTTQRSNLKKKLLLNQQQLNKFLCPDQPR